MGLLDRVDWSAEWVATPADPPGGLPVEPHNGFLYPVRFTIEASLRSDWSDARVVVDRTDADEERLGLGFDEQDAHGHSSRRGIHKRRGSTREDLTRHPVPRPDLRQ
jgi:hypothetical protein